MSDLKTRSLGERKGFPAFIGPILKPWARRRLLEEHQVDWSESGKCYILYRQMNAADFEMLMRQAEGWRREDVGTPKIGGSAEKAPRVDWPPQTVVVQKPIRVKANVLAPKETVPPPVSVMPPNPKLAERFFNQRLFYVEMCRPQIVKLCDIIRNGALPISMAWIKPGHVAWAFGQEEFDGQMSREEFERKQFTGIRPEDARKQIVALLT